jgi:hypothetical protein
LKFDSEPENFLIYSAWLFFFVREMSVESDSNLNQKDQEAQDINLGATDNVSDQKSDVGTEEPKILPNTENPDNQIDQNVHDKQP